MDLAISNDPAHAAAHFDAFFLAEACRIKIAAAYTEINGLDINPDRWHCDLFAYTSYGGHDGDYDWIAQWDSELFEPFVIRGLEPLQAVYASDAFHEDAFNDAIYMCDLLVVIKFPVHEKSDSSQERIEISTVGHRSRFRLHCGVSPTDSQLISRLLPNSYLA